MLGVGGLLTPPARGLLDSGVTESQLLTIFSVAYMELPTDQVTVPHLHQQGSVTIALIMRWINLLLFF